jgi:hypothetical protein
MSITTATDMSDIGRIFCELLYKSIVLWSPFCLQIFLKSKCLMRIRVLNFSINVLN